MAIPHISERCRFWHDIIRGCAPRSLGRIRDRLIPIAGLAKVYRDIIGDEQYFAGLWKQDMSCGLSWYVPGASLIPPTSTTNLPKRGNQNPSWSLASSPQSATVVNDHAQNGFRALACVEDVEVDLVDPLNSFGAVKGSRTTINDRLMNLKPSTTIGGKIRKHLCEL
jgi:hypothetical protein